jgi:Flavin containing amine oxidoreductase
MMNMDGTTNNNNRNNNKNKNNSNTVVQVTLQSGITFEVDAVVCTIPLGVLKDGSVTFEPPLPMEKQNAIQNLGSGLLNKCALTFAQQFWQNSDFLGLADHQHSYLVLNAAKYTSKPVLLFMYGGSFAKEMEEWTDMEVVEDCLAILRRICGRECVTAPLDYHVTRWGKEPYSRMSFTYVPPGVNGISELQAMSQPIYDHTGRIPVLMFAGEHTSPYHPSTIHGAFLSGIREAYRLDCALEPAANDYLEFTDDHVYQPTFNVKRKVRLNSGVATTAGLPVAEMASPDATSGKRRRNTAATANNPIQPYRRRRGANGMTLRRRPKTYIQLETSSSGTKRAATTSISTSTTTTTIPSTPIAVPSETIPSPHPASTRRSPRVVTASRTASLTSVVPLNGCSFSRPERVVSSHSNGNTKKSEKEYQHPQLPRTATSVQRERTACENRILSRSLDSFGPDFDYIEKTILPIHSCTSVHPTTTIPNNGGDHGHNHHHTNNGRMDRSQMEQRCQKILLKKEKWNITRQATVLSHFKSWISLRKVVQLPPHRNSKTTKSTTSLSSSNHTLNNGMKHNEKSHRKIPAVTTTTGVMTRFGRISKPPVTGSNNK